MNGGEKRSDVSRQWRLQEEDGDPRKVIGRAPALHPKESASQRDPDANLELPSNPSGQLRRAGGVGGAGGAGSTLIGIPKGLFFDRWSRVG